MRRATPRCDGSRCATATSAAQTPLGAPRPPITATATHHRRRRWSTAHSFTPQPPAPHRHHHTTCCCCCCSRYVGEAKRRPHTLMTLAMYSLLRGGRKGLHLYGRDYDTPDGTTVRDYVHPTDLAKAHLEALRFLRNGQRSQVFNLGTGRGSSVLEVRPHPASAVLPTRVDLPRPPAISRRLVGDRRDTTSTAPPLRTRHTCPRTGPPPQPSPPPPASRRCCARSTRRRGAR